MTDQLELPTRLADEAMERVMAAERVAEWKRKADDYLATFGYGLYPHTFTADDLVAAIGRPDFGPARNNVVGAWFNAQAKAGRIEWTGMFRKSTRPEGHGNQQRVWRVVR